MVITPKLIFWKAIETKEKCHTSAFIAQEFETVINEVETDKIAVVIMDNASNMRGVHKLLQIKYPNIFFFR